MEGGSDIIFYTRLDVLTKVIEDVRASGELSRILGGKSLERTRLFITAEGLGLMTKAEDLPLQDQKSFNNAIKPIMSRLLSQKG